MGKKDPLQALAGGGSGGLKKVAGIAIAIALFVIVVKFPGEAANWVSELWDLGEGAIDGIVSFIRQAA